MSESESAKKEGLGYLKDLAQKLYEIGTTPFQSVSDVLNELAKELNLDDVKTATIDSANGKLTVVAEIRSPRLEMELTLQSSESQPNENKEDSPKRMFCINKIHYAKRVIPQNSKLCSIISSLIQNWVLPIAILVFLSILPFFVRLFK